MLTKLALGAEVDIATSGEVSDNTDRVLDFMRGTDIPKPTLNTVTQAVAFTSPGTLILNCGSPPVGRIWNILGLTLCGPDDATQSSAGTIGFYIGGIPSSGSPSLGQLRVPRLTLPTSQTFTKGVHWCNPNDNIFFNLVGLTVAGQAQIVANVYVAEWREHDVLEATGR